MSWRRFGFKFAAVFFVVLGLGYLLPNFSILPVSTAAIAGLAIAGLNFFVETIILKKEVLPFTQGLISFFLSLFGLISLKNGYSDRLFLVKLAPSRADHRPC